MCWLCENPEATWDDYVDQVRLSVAANGFSFVSVEGDRLRRGYLYTVGLTEHGEPELLVTE
jgi:hypothetical protein